MANRVLKVHPDDNVIVALQPLQAGETVELNGQQYAVAEDIAVKHKFTEAALQPGDVLQLKIEITRVRRIAPATIRTLATASPGCGCVVPLLEATAGCPDL